MYAEVWSPDVVAAGRVEAAATFDHLLPSVDRMDSFLTQSKTGQYYQHEC